jgi:hypothetical protein
MASMRKLLKRALPLDVALNVTRDGAAADEQQESPWLATWGSLNWTSDGDEQQEPAPWSCCLTGCSLVPWRCS